MVLELGKKSTYESQYNPDKLFAIARIGQRMEIGIRENAIPFYGYDVWNHYEVSWLNLKGKPKVAICEIIYDCHSPNIIESKSMKLYFNTLNNTQFESALVVEELIKKDLSQRVGSEVQIRLHPLNSKSLLPMQVSFNGECLDDLDISCNEYTVNPNYLKTSDELVEESLYSDLLKSNCLVTNQPDWASVFIHYKGPKINREGLLQYIVSFRNHNEFHEHCIERIYMDISNYCKPQELTIQGCFTRRGGVDINPWRSSRKSAVPNEIIRLIRQ